MTNKEFEEFYKEPIEHLIKENIRQRRQRCMSILIKSIIREILRDLSKDDGVYIIQCCGTKNVSYQYAIDRFHYTF